MQLTKIHTATRQSAVYCKWAETFILSPLTWKPNWTPSEKYWNTFEKKKTRSSQEGTNTAQARQSVVASLNSLFTTAQMPEVFRRCQCSCAAKETDSASSPAPLQWNSQGGAGCTIQVGLIAQWLHIFCSLGAACISTWFLVKSQHLLNKWYDLDCMAARNPSDETSVSINFNIYDNFTSSRQNVTIQVQETGLNNAQMKSMPRGTANNYSLYVTDIHDGCRQAVRAGTGAQRIAIPKQSPVPSITFPTTMHHLPDLSFQIPQYHHVFPKYGRNPLYRSSSRHENIHKHIFIAC